MAMTMTGEVTLPADRSKVWAMLNDPAVLKACIPGCQSLDKTSDTSFAAVARIKIGPVGATFKGKVQLFQGSLQVIFTQLERLAAEQVDLADFLPRTEKDVGRLFERLRTLLLRLENPHLRALAECFLMDGPFAETKELVGGFWLWQVRSMDEAVEWLKRAPFQDGEEVEIRQVFEAEDFGTEFTPELREQEERQRKQVEKQKAS